MKRAVLWTDHVDAISSDESSSSDADDGCGCQQSSNDTAAIKDLTSEGALFKKAELYLEYMKQIPIPTHRGSIIPFTSGVGLGNSIKQLYQQPVHCLTNILLKQWDKSRFDSEHEYEPLDIVIHPRKAEATIWLIEEVHRHGSSHHHLAKL